MAALCSETLTQLTHTTTTSSSNDHVKNPLPPSHINPTNTTRIYIHKYFSARLRPPKVLKVFLVIVIHISLLGYLTTLLQLQVLCYTPAREEVGIWKYDVLKAKQKHEHLTKLYD